MTIRQPFQIEREHPELRRGFRFHAVRDDGAGVWTATSDQRITTEAETIDSLLERLAVLVPDVLQSRGFVSGLWS